MKFNIHHYHHILYDPIVLNKLNKMEVILMAALDELKANVGALIVTVANQTTIIDSAVALIKGQTTAMAELQVALNLAIQNGNPIDVQAASDAIKAQNDDIIAETQKLAEAVIANVTPPVFPPVVTP
jgi:hypothetical protein